MLGKKMESAVGSVAFKLASSSGQEDLLAETKSRVEFLTRLKEELGSKAGDELDGDPQIFRRLLTTAQTLLEVDDDALAARVRTSRPTIGRWSRGETCPHPIAMRAVYRTLDEWVGEKLKTHKSMVQKGRLPKMILEP